MTVPGPLDMAGAAIAAALAQINHDIAACPGPVAGSDTQFNHLLDCRRRLEPARAELDRAAFVPTPRQPDRPG